MGSQVAIRSTFVAAGDNLVESHRRVLDYWNQIRGDRWAPKLSEFKLIELDPEVIPFVNITNLTAEPLTSTIRFWGTGLTTAFGGDYTGHSPVDVPPKTIGLSAKGGCGRLVNEKTPHCEVKQFETMNGYLGRAVVLRLPCSDDGISVANGIGVYQFEHVNPDARLSAFFDEVFRPLGSLSGT